MIYRWVNCDFTKGEFSPPFEEVSKGYVLAQDGR